MTAYRFRAVSGVVLFLVLSFAVLALGAVDPWALTVVQLLAFLLAAVWTLRAALGNTGLVWDPFFAPLGVVVAWSAAQARWGLSIDSYRSAAEALKWLALALLYLVARQVFTDHSIRRNFTLALMWLGFVVSLLGIIQHFGAPGRIYWSMPVLTGRPFGSFINANHFAAWIELLIPAALLAATRRSEQQLIYVAVCGTMLMAVIATNSRAGIVLVAAQTLIVMGAEAWRARQGGRRPWPALVGVAAVAGMVLLVLKGPAAFHFAEERPYAVRWAVAQATWGLFLDRPWTGFGAGTFDQVYPSAAPFDMGLFWAHAHNDPVQFAMEWGVPGLAALAAMVVLLLRRRWPLEVWLRTILPAMTALAHSWVDFPLQIPAVTATWLVTVAMLPSGPLPEARQPLGRAGQDPHLHPNSRSLATLGMTGLRSDDRATLGMTGLRSG